MSEPAPSLDGLDVAVAHWHVDAWGGAEYLTTQLAEALGVDAVYTMGPPDPAEDNPYGDVEFVDVLSTLRLSGLRGLQCRVGRVFEYGLWEDVDWRDLGDPDIIVTSGATTRAVITPDDTLHVNYCHSPPRWFYDRYHDRKDSWTGVLARPLLRYLRLRDQTIDPRVDHYFVNSPIIERRLWKYYKRESEVLYPPVELEHYRNAGDQGYYLHLGRLDTEKGIDAVVEAFDGREESLILAGGRGDVSAAVLDQIERASNIDYRGFVSEAAKRELLAGCTALVFNGVNEDFGIVPIEAAASGKPVLARNDGFPGLFVRDGATGYHHDGTPDGIRTAVQRCQTNPVVPSDAAVAQFSKQRFRDQLRRSLREAYDASITVTL